MFDVFVSYNSKDKQQAEDLAKRLQERALAVWIDLCELRPGQNWIDDLHRAIQQVRSAVVLVGQHGTGPWQQQEIAALLVETVQRGKPVIPVLLPDAPLQPALPPFLVGFTWVDFRGGFTDAALERLQWGITGIRPSRKTLASSEGHSHILFGNPRALYDQPFAAMVYRLEHELKRLLHLERVDGHLLYELTDVLIRSTLRRMRPDWLPILWKYQGSNELPAWLPNEEESALRELRNLGLIQHDGRWLFTPTRSKAVAPSSAGGLILQLWREEAADTDAIREYLQAAVNLAGEAGNWRVLDHIRRTGRFHAAEVDRVRMLRDRNLVAHKAYYLASANQAMLTELGATILSPS